MKRNTLIMVAFLLLGTLLYGCGTLKETSPPAEKEVKSASSEPVKVYTTIFPLQDFTEKIGGNHVEVVSVFPAGVDAHTYEPTVQTMVDIAKADALIYTGAGVEGFVEAGHDALKNEHVKIVKAADGIELLPFNEAHEEEHHEDSEDEHHDDHHEDQSTSEDEHHETESHTKHEHHHGDADPHVWLDPVLAIDLAENILHALEQLKPEAKEDFKRNFEKLTEELQLLNQEFSTVIQNSTKKEILVSHAAYGYWEARYGIEQISVSGLSPTDEPSQKDLMNIINTSKEHNIKYVLFEQNLSMKIAEMVKHEIGAEALTLHNLEAITNEDQTNNEDYFSIMRRNLETLTKALH
ncbi:adhesin [Bacillus sp. BGMRC 2118]|nr:adhesin [Bacillus sp. BGMRC 2118]